MDFRTYLFRRLLLMVPTFLGITLLNFGFIQLAPGGPVESYIAKVRYAGGAGGSGGAGGGLGSSAGGGAASAGQSTVTKEVIVR